MMKRLIALSCLALMSACTAPAYQLSGPVSAAPPAPREPGLTIGVVADSQLNTFAATKPVEYMKGWREDWLTGVALRSPALNWSARSMLWTHLSELKSRGAKAIFYVGDGANNGCRDEFVEGSGTAPTSLSGRNRLGILPLLKLFSDENGIPIFFVLGNHDFLGAGNTSHIGLRKDLCSDPPRAEDILIDKFEAMSLVDDFNRRSAVKAGFRYRSNLELQGRGEVEKRCSAAMHQARQPGCYLAGILDAEVGGQAVQFLFVDNNDYVDVSRSVPARFAEKGLEYEGMRGAISFSSEDSQTKWFNRNAFDRVPIRIAVMHYPLVDLRKNLGFLRLSKKTQQVSNLFTLEDTTGRAAKQADAFVISAHTHKKTSARGSRWMTRCGPVRCARSDQFLIEELNVGSTTDWPAESALVGIQPGTDARRAALTYQTVPIVLGQKDIKQACAATIREIEAFPFPAAFETGETRGWSAIGINLDNPAAYRKLRSEDFPIIKRNLEAFVREDERRANCIGLLASELESRERQLTRPF
jgi:hypothetical protein